MEDKKREENKYDSFASSLDEHSGNPRKKSVSVENEEFRKLTFLWDECHPEKIGTEEVCFKTLKKIRKYETAICHRRILRLTWLGSVAASILLLAGGTILFLQKEKGSNVTGMEQYIQANLSADDVKEVTLVVSDNKKIELANNSQVAYSSTGQVHVNADKLKEEETEEKFNQIIVPKGRRSMIVLADNSKIWINSGSKVLYPRSFGEGERKIFVEGEVYLKVTHDESRPFIVSTASFDVEVLGTSFNVTAYKDSPEAAVVLVEGGVNVKDRQERHIRMSPNERVALNETGISKKEKVDAREYIRWVDGVWVLKGESLQEVVWRLTKYYGQSIHCDASIENEPVYGKLFLNEELDRVLESLKSALPATQTMQENVIYKDSI